MSMFRLGVLLAFQVPQPSIVTLTPRGLCTCYPQCTELFFLYHLACLTPTCLSDFISNIIFRNPPNLD